MLAVPPYNPAQNVVLHEVLLILAHRAMDSASQ